MATYRVTIHNAVLNKEVTQALGKSPAVREAAYKKMYGLFKQAKRAMLQEFDRHPVTQEILGGPRAVNLTNTLDGYGNLFAFIGFDSGDAPTQRLRDLLDVATNFRQTVYKDRKWYFQVILPSRQAIEIHSQMPWDIGSWAFNVERGISGLSHFLYKRWGGGRSGMGLQLPYENMEDASFQPTPYLTEILENFRKRLGI